LTEAAPTEPSSIGRLARGLAPIVVAIGITLRFLDLGADPYYYEWNGYITDEGRWIAHARAFALFGEIGSVGSSLHLLLAPLFQAATFAVFALFDVSLWSARLVSAVSGSAVLGAFWAAYRRVASPEALLLGLAMLAVEMDLVALSRLAIPEMAAMGLSLGAFLLILGDRPGRARLVVAGILTAAAVGMKATALPVAPIFAAVVLLRHRAQGEGLSRGGALAALGAGLLVAALIAGAALVAAGSEGAALVALLLRIVRAFVRLTDLYALLAFPFDDALAPVLGIWTLAAWLGILGGLAGVEARVDAPARRHLVAAFLWAGLLAPIMLLLAYFPSRYKLHILVPLAVIVTVGITQFQGAGLRGLDTALSRLRGARRVGAALLVALPTSVVAGAALLSLGTVAGLDPERLRVRYAGVLLLLATVAGLILLQLHRGHGIGFLVWFPVCWAGGWLLAERLSLVSPSFWPGAEGGGTALRWLLLLAGAAGAIGAARAGRWGRPAAAVALVAAAALYAGLGVVRVAPGYLEPHYTMREASRDLGVLLARVPGRIGAIGGDSVFSENRLPYRSLLGRRWPASPPDVLILAGLLEDPQGRLGREYWLIRQYAIYVSPEYVLGEVSWKPTQGQFMRTNIRVYQRRYQAAP
jgi:Dolichyl-phosphate-mannose-protein mannosyltransferase